jgi:transcriptional regulator with XRE-family HTH domain
MRERGYKASQVADGAGITRPVMSRYLANRSGISAENLIKLSQYLNVSPDWLLNGSDAPESIKMSRDVSMDKNKIIALQDKRIEDLEQKVKEWEDWKAGSKDRHAKGKAKADLAIAKNKNTLRINTTRKRKK